MLDVVFSQNFSNSLKLAMSHPDCIGFSATALTESDTEDSISPAQREQAQQEAEARFRREMEQAVPIEGNPAKVLCFYLGLEYGAIDEDAIGKQRRRELTKLADDSSCWVDQSLNTAKKDLERLLHGAKNGESLRIWCGHLPGDICGLHWLAAQLLPLGPENLHVSLVQLPEFIPHLDGTVIQCCGWEDISPYQLGQFVQETRLPANYLRGLAWKWQSLQQENAPLRAMVNTRLVSVPADFYDPFILQALDKMPNYFFEPKLIGYVLGTYQLGIGDSFLTQRIQRWVENGQLHVTEPEKDTGHGYARWLEKV